MRDKGPPGYGATGSSFAGGERDAHLRGFVSCEHVSQPSLSQQIHKLEEELNQPLFDRLPRSVVLTAAGRCLLPYAEITPVRLCNLPISAKPEDPNAAAEILTA